jgi:hypothetical protein
MRSAALIPQQIKDYAVGIPTCLAKRAIELKLSEVRDAQNLDQALSDSQLTHPT